MIPEITIENDKNFHNDSKEYSGEDSAVFKTMRLSINLVVNLLIVLTVFVCMLYAWTSPKLNLFQLHIVLCVLGYQFFMSQGILVLSKFNSWSMYLSWGCKRHLHWFLQLVGIVLVTIGSSVMIYEKHVNFNTAHGITGLIALIASLVGLLNGLIAMHAYKLREYVRPYWIKHIHYVTGIGALIFSAICLCLGFDQIAFKSWSGTQDAVALMILTCLFTVFVAMDFWIVVGSNLMLLT